MLWALLILAIVVWFSIKVAYVIQLRHRADRAWSDIGVQLRFRDELIAELVELLRGLKVGEPGVYRQVMEARTRAMDASGPRVRATAEELLEGYLKHIYALSKNSAQLQSSSRFASLRHRLEGVSMVLVDANRYYDAVTLDYNRRLCCFPACVFTVGGMLEPKDLFQAEKPCVVGNRE